MNAAWKFLLALLPLGGIAGEQARTAYPDIPSRYLEEAAAIPDFWVSDVAGVYAYLDRHVQKGTVRQFGTTAGGRPMRLAAYGKPRGDRGTTTFSGSLGFGDVRAYLGPDHEKKVYWAMAAVHGGEFEAIAGMVNLISVLETGRDLRGKPWPEITAAANRRRNRPAWRHRNPTVRRRTTSRSGAPSRRLWCTRSYADKATRNCRGR